MKRQTIGWLTKDWPLKLVSLGLALVLWLLLVPSQKMSTEKSLTIPLETLNIPAGLEIVERPVATVDITLRAPSRILGQIGPSDLVAGLDLGRATVLQQEYPLHKSMIAVPPDVEVVKISPSKLTIRLERTSQARIEVHPTLRGRPAQGFRVARTEIEPSNVTVQGPESLVEAAQAATTAPIDVAGLTESTVFDADIILPRPELRFVTPQTRARVTVLIEETAAPAAKTKR